MRALQTPRPEGAARAEEPLAGAGAAAAAAGAGAAVAGAGTGVKRGEADAGDQRKGAVARRGEPKAPRVCATRRGAAGGAAEAAGASGAAAAAAAAAATALCLSRPHVVRTAPPPRQETLVERRASKNLVEGARERVGTQISPKLTPWPSTL